MDPPTVKRLLPEAKGAAHYDSLPSMVPKGQMPAGPQDAQGYMSAYTMRE